MENLTFHGGLYKWKIEDKKCYFNYGYLYFILFSIVMIFDYKMCWL